jgi:hypothetical protein
VSAATAGTRTVTATGFLADSSGTGIGGAPIRLTARPERVGAWGVYRITGVVPPGAARALVGIRVNVECGCAGDSEVAFADARYRELSAVGEASPPRGRRPQAAPAVHLDGSDFTGATPARLDTGTGARPGILQLRTRRTSSALLNSTFFSVRPGAPYELAITARVSPGSVGSGYFAIVFVGAGEISRERIPFAPAAAARASVTTSGSGTYAAELRNLPPGEFTVEAVFHGDTTFWPALARRGIVVPAPGRVIGPAHRPGVSGTPAPNPVRGTSHPGKAVQDDGAPEEP